MINNLYDQIKSNKSSSNYICQFECESFGLKETIKLQEIDAIIYNSQKHKFDLENNFTFVVPVKIDCIERKNNLHTIIDFIYENFINFKVIVSEQSTNQEIIQTNKFNYLFKFSVNRYHKTKCVNDAVKLIDTDFGCMYDADYIVTPMSLFHCFNKLKKDYHFAHPSIGMNIYFDKHHTSVFKLQNKLPLQSEINYHHFFEPAHYPGLCFMFKTKDYFEIGLENENFITWGFEDHERFIRIEKLQKKVYYSPACGYHLWHPRKGDFYYKVKFEDDKIVELFDNQDHKDELIKVNAMSKEELMSYVDSWPWNKIAPLNQ